MKRRSQRRKKPPRKSPLEKPTNGDVVWRKRISIDPKIHHGDPCVKGTRIPVSIIVGSIADGDSFETLLRAYPQISSEDIRACLIFAAEAVNRFDYIPASN